MPSRITALGADPGAPEQELTHEQTARRHPRGAGTDPTVQLTSKRLKAHLALSVIAIILGLVLFLPNLPDQTRPERQVNGTALFAGFGLVGAGIFWAVVTKVRIWWNHG